MRASTFGRAPFEIEPSQASEPQEVQMVFRLKWRSLERNYFAPTRDDRLLSSRRRLIKIGKQAFKDELPHD